jgi:hypothetical protein
VAAPTPPKPADPKAAQDASGRARNAGDELLDECTALEAEVEELKVKYEMYFLGVELREPTKWREETRKKVLRIKEKFTRNTGLRFRLQSLHARFLSYERLWLRSAREREEGTYRRDLFKARLHGRGKAPAAVGPAARKGTGKPAEHLPGEDVDLSDFGDEPTPEPTPRPVATMRPSSVPAPTVPLVAERPALTPLPARPALTPTPGSLPTAARPAAGPGPGAPARGPVAAPRPPPAAAAGARLGEAQLRELYDAYLTAKKRCNEDTSRITFDAVKSSVSKQIPEIMKQHNAKSVEFKVVIKDGKARLTAVPKT